MSLLSITKKPVLPVIELIKNDDTLLTFNPLAASPTFDFRLGFLEFEPPYDALGGKFKMKLISNDASNSEANTLLSNVNVGNELLIYLGKTDAGKKKLFRGVIETWNIREPNKNYMSIEADGPDWGSDLLKSRVVNGQWIQAKAANGVDLDNTDNAVLLAQITEDLLTKTQSYPINLDTVESQGVVVSSANITPPALRLSQFDVNMEFLDDKLQEIDAIGGTVHYIDPDKNFFMKPTNQAIASLPKDTLITDDYTDSIAVAWDQTKLGMIAPDSTYKQSLEHHKRRLYGLGGDQLTLDQKQETDSTSTEMFSNYLAMKFTPSFRNIDSIGVILSKTGSPSLGPVLELIEDLNGEPTGTVIRSISKDKDAITGTAAWHYFKINDQLNTAKDYWVVMPIVGDDVSNTFNWHRDSTSSFTNAFSADGASWTVQTSSYGYTFRQYTINPLLSVFSDSQPITAKHYHEDVIRKPFITDRAVMQQLLASECETLCKRKDIFKGLIYAPDTLLQAGQIVRIRKQASGYQVDADFILGRVDYVFSGGPDGATGEMYYNVEATRFVDIN